MSVSLVKPYKNTNRNITGDNWFTSYPLVIDLLENYGLTYTGTMRLDKPHTPAVMKDTKIIPKGHSAFIDDDKLTMVSFHPNKNKYKFVHLYSTMHDQPNIQDFGKPEITEYYNKTKYGVDTFDQMCAYYSCNRKTKRWPLCLFYGMVSAATINAHVIYNKMQNNIGEPGMDRRTFMLKLAENLVFPWAEDRMSFPGLKRVTQLTIRDVFDINLPTCRPAQGPRTLKRCVRCPRKKDRKTKQQCIHCQCPVCGEHPSLICSDCT